MILGLLEPVFQSSDEPKNQFRPPREDDRSLFDQPCTLSVQIVENHNLCVNVHFQDCHDSFYLALRGMTTLLPCQVDPQDLDWCRIRLN